MRGALLAVEQLRGQLAICGHAAADRAGRIGQQGVDGNDRLMGGGNQVRAGGGLGRGGRHSESPAGSGPDGAFDALQHN